MSKVTVDVASMLGRHIDCIEQWNRVESAYRELSDAIMTMGGDADSKEQQIAMGEWLASVVMNGKAATKAMCVLYPDKKDAPWNP